MLAITERVIERQLERSSTQQQQNKSALSQSEQSSGSTTPHLMQDSTRRHSALTLTQVLQANCASSLTVSTSGIPMAQLLNTRVTPNETSQIHSLRCFDLDSLNMTSLDDRPTLIACMRHTNALYRHLAAGQRFAAMRKVYEQHKTKQAKLHVIAEMLRSDEESTSDDAEEQKLLRPQAHEFVSWQLFAECVNWFCCWHAHHLDQPCVPATKNSHAAVTATASGQLNRISLPAPQRQKFEAEVSQWRETDAENISTLVSVFHSCLQMHSGWLLSVAETKRCKQFVDTPAATAQSFVTHCLALYELKCRCVPLLIFMLHKATHDSQAERHCLNVPVILASNRDALYDCCSQAEMCNFRRKMRKTCALFILDEERNSATANSQVNSATADATLSQQSTSAQQHAQVDDLEQLQSRTETGHAVRRIDRRSIAARH